ncbi:mechanosensitive ion channel family protein [Haloarcula sp. CBA1130]|uniref:mechanosensitive ion channel family protein n=1 Tax=unclassified Haloarcula TaxID=2624677 RepID=UPI001245E530|nr:MULTISPECIES: mechanosensitive ion channel family protein [unclassified Haloarcula]KAA9399329.1 mechanosensitive ion channel family protein [Haloarcula sp. CBA1129]KAA9403843.1 mechanosensitive ion channel family protein [Haloarcula sp. CBA1130]
MRRTGYLSLLCALVLYAGSRFVRRFGFDERVLGVELEPLTLLGLTLASLVLAFYGSYTVCRTYLVTHTQNKRRQHDVRNVLRLTFGIVGMIAVFGVVTREWVSVLFSLGVLGFAVTFALQQPLFSLIGWLYIVTKRPYQVGDRIAIEEMRGDVVAVDFFVTEVWEIDGDLVSSNQPSGRIVTVPNSTVLSSRVVNFYGEGVQYVWNELSIQVAYETDLQFASEVMVDVATDHLGDEMAEQVREYRTRLAETPVELDVNERPTVNITQQESWVELRLRYLVHPRRGTRMRNALYADILEQFNEHPERVKFPVSRNR